MTKKQVLGLVTVCMRKGEAIAKIRNNLAVMIKLQKGKVKGSF